MNSINCFKNIIFFLLVSFVLSGSVIAKPVTIKLATLAPEGTSWVNFLREFDAELRKATNNEVSLKIYPGGIMGDENVVLQKLRAGQLNAAAVTGIGLGQIESSVRILEMPFLFTNYKEIDHVVANISDTLKKNFEKKGYTVLGWAETGLVHFFSKTPITSLETLKTVKMWAWNSDPMVKIMFKEFNINPVPLELPDVPMSLDTGIITACYATPIAALSLQWSPRVNYITRQNLAYSSGALIIQKDLINKMSKDQQKILMDLGTKYSKLITDAVRKENQDAFNLLAKEGKKVVDFEPSQVKPVMEKARTIRKNLSGQFYSKELHNTVIKLRNEFRASEITRLISKISELKKNKKNTSELKEMEAQLKEMKSTIEEAKNDFI